MTLKRPLIVIPCFNEVSRFKVPYWEFVIQKAQSFDFLFANDGSTDETQAKIEPLLRFPNASLINFPNNRGKAEAIRNSILCNCRNRDIFGYIDSDGSTPKEQVLDFLIQNYKTLTKDKSEVKIVIGSRIPSSNARIQRTLIRELIGKSIVAALKLIWRDIPKDPQNGLKLLKLSSNSIYIFSKPFATQWFFDLEIICRLMQKRYISNLIIEVPIQTWIEVPGSKIVPTQYLNIMKQFITISRVLRKTTKSVNLDRNYCE